MAITHPSGMHMPKLPDPVLQRVFAHLPVDVLLRCICVHPDWARSICTHTDWQLECARYGAGAGPGFWSGLEKPDYSREDFEVDPVKPSEDAIAELGRGFLLERAVRRQCDQPCSSNPTTLSCAFRPGAFNGHVLVRLDKGFSQCTQNSNIFVWYPDLLRGWGRTPAVGGPPPPAHDRLWVHFLPDRRHFLSFNVIGQRKLLLSLWHTARPRACASVTLDINNTFQYLIHGDRIYFIEEDGHVYLFNLNTLQQLQPAEPRICPTACRSRTGWHGAGGLVIRCPDFHLVAYDLDTLQLRHHVHVPGPVKECYCSQDGRHVLLSLPDHTVHLVDLLAKGGAQLVASSPDLDAPVHSVYMHSDKCLVHCSEPAKLHVLDMELKSLWKLEVASIAPDQRWCFLGTDTMCLPGRGPVYSWCNERKQLTEVDHSVFLRLHAEDPRPFPRVEVKDEPEPSAGIQTTRVVQPSTSQNPSHRPKNAVKKFFTNLLKKNFD